MRARSSCSTAPAPTWCRCGPRAGAWEGVICAETAHLNVDECGAPEAIAGAQAADRPGDRRQAHARSSSRAGSRASATSTRVQPPAGLDHAVAPSSARCTRPTRCTRSPSSRTRTTWCCTSTARGSRNAAAALGVPLRGGHDRRRRRTSCPSAAPRTACSGRGGGAAEPRARRTGFEYLRKQSMQLASKMRFLAAQFDALLTDDLWLRCAAARQRDGRAAGRRGARPARGSDHAAGADERGVRDRCPGRASAALQRQFPLLRLG